MGSIKAYLQALWQSAGPYVLVELLLPGGSLLAILLFLYRRRAAVGTLRRYAAPAVTREARAGTQLAWSMHGPAHVRAC